MTEMEKRLHTGLSEEDEAFLARLEDEPGLFAQLGATFTGSMKFWTAFAVALSLIFFFGSIWALWQASVSANAQEAVVWTGGALGAWFAVGMIKIWFWLRMNHLVTLKEIKRLELKVSQLNTF
ncbi:DUF6768 family protein [Henriciella sp.]|uniref:DUF6768 family protein n=1 Tax=Henriciella sp. TaxID=1968823 RepID=UPI00262F9F43|nr:DUF6768 family protein [Henriciella sp.]